VTLNKLLIIIAAIMIQNIGFNSISNVMIDCAQVKFIVLVKLNDCDGKIDLYQKNHCGIKASW